MLFQTARYTEMLTEGLNNAFYWGAQMVGALLIGKFLDSSRLPVLVVTRR